MQRGEAKRFGKRVCAAAAGLLLLFLCCCPAAAYESFGPASAEGRLTIRYEAQGAEFMLYRVADFEMDEDGSIHLPQTAAFSKAGVALEQLKKEEWSVAAETLRAYAATQQIQADQSAVIGEDGTAVIGQLQRGLYLLVSDECVYRGYRYAATVTLLTLPHTEDEVVTNTSVWTSEAEVLPKSEKEPVTEELQAYRVLKQWAGDTKNSRPESITVTILCTDRDPVSGERTESRERVTLSADNDWSYSWRAKTATAEYTVDEDPVPDGYSREIRKTVDRDEGTVVFVVKNTGAGGGTITPTVTPPGTTGRVKTGDNSRILLFGVLFAASLAVLLIGLITGRRRS